MSAPTKEEISGVIISKLPFNTPDLTKFVNDFSDSLSKTWKQVEQGIQIPAITVAGGAAPPGGPLQGGIGILAPGGMIMTTKFINITNNFQSSFPDGPTEGLKSLVKTIANGFDTVFSVWVTGYSNTTIIAKGGIVAFTPVAPGAWSAGEIAPTKVISGISPGLSAIKVLGKTITAQSLPPLSPPTGDLISFYNAIGSALEIIHKNWMSKTDIKALAPTGVGIGAAGTGSIISGTVMGCGLS